MTKLLEFLTDVAANPQKQVAFLQGSQGVLEAAGLTQAELSAIASKDSTRVAAAFADELYPVAIALREPDPDPTPDPDTDPDTDSSENN